MDDPRNDTELLREYAQSRSPQVLGALALRYADFVYSAARRQVPDAHLAEDVAQGVFILLARKAQTMRDSASLVGWLYNTTRYVAANARKMESRRKHYEQQAAMEHSASNQDKKVDDRWSELMPVIDGAMDGLGEQYRQSLLLRYFQGKSVREVASAMDVPQETAKKRLARALEMLRKMLAGKGLVITSALLASTLAARATEAAPLALQQVLPALIAGQVGAASPTAVAITSGSVSLGKLWSAVAACLAVTLGAFLLASLVVARQKHATAAMQSAAVAPAPQMPPPSGPSPAAVAQGWPIALPGTITGSPMAVDLDGDGKLDIVVPYMGMIPDAAGGGGAPAGGVQPDFAAKVAAFHADGKPLAGWPVTIMSDKEHLASKNEPFPNWWGSTPSVIGAQGDQPGIVAISHPAGLARKSRGASVIRGNGAAIKLATSLAFSDPGTTLVLADLSSDGNISVLGGGTFATVANRGIPTWHGQPMPKGFSSSVGDVNGDGHLKIFTVGGRHNALNGEVFAYDITGKALPGWPQKIGRQAIPVPSLGNVYGDDKMEVILPDQHRHILAWTWDGQPFGNTFPETQGQVSQGPANALTPAQLENEKCTSIFKDGIQCSGQVALADLDGDGLAEIILIDQTTSTLRAWHGDGTGFGNADGIIATLGPGMAEGVSVAGPDELGGFDFFAGSYWVHRDSDGVVNTRQMVQLASAPPATAPTTEPSTIDVVCQDTLVDLYGDGKAEVLMGTTDGRVFVYHTGLKYSNAWAQWPMIGDNPQHTGCWKRPGH